MQVTMGLKMNIPYIIQVISFIQYYIISISPGVSAFQQKYHHQPIRLSIPHSNHNLLLSSSNNGNNGDSNNNIWNGISSLWDEIIEMSTYGPSERKMLKLQRERQMQRENEMVSTQIDDDSTAISNQFETNDDDDQAWLEAFTSAKEDSDTTTNDNKLDYDGYQLRDLLVSKWGVPNDIDFQQINGGLYCTILPVLGYGNALSSRHENELQYLMHLQGIVEILNKYDVLEDFINFVIETDKRPKRGTDSVPYRLDLSRDDIDKITSQ